MSLSLWDESGFIIASLSGHMLHKHVPNNIRNKAPYKDLKKSSAGGIAVDFMVGGCPVVVSLSAPGAPNACVFMTQAILLISLSFTNLHHKKQMSASLLSNS